MSKPKVYLSCPLQPEIRELLAETTEVAYWPEWTPVPQDILKKECNDASGLMIQVFNMVEAALLESSPDMKVVSIVGSGTECVDIETGTSKGIPVGNTPGAASKGTADRRWLCFWPELVASQRSTGGPAPEIGSTTFPPWIWWGRRCTKAPWE